MSARRLDAPDLAGDPDRIEEARPQVVEKLLAGDAPDEDGEHHRGGGVVAEYLAGQVRGRRPKEGVGPVRIAARVGAVAVLVGRGHHQQVADRGLRHVGMEIRRRLVREVFRNGIIEPHSSLAHEQPDRHGHHALAGGIEAVETPPVIGAPVRLDGQFAPAEHQHAVQAEPLRLQPRQKARHGLGRNSGALGRREREGMRLLAFLLQNHRPMHATIRFHPFLQRRSPRTP